MCINSGHLVKLSAEVGEMTRLRNLSDTNIALSRIITELQSHTVLAAATLTNKTANKDIVGI